MMSENLSSRSSHGMRCAKGWIMYRKIDCALRIKVLFKIRIHVVEIERYNLQSY